MLGDIIKELSNNSNSWRANQIDQYITAYIDPKNKQFQESPIYELLENPEYEKLYTEFLDAKQSREELVELFKESTGIHPSLLSQILPHDTKNVEKPDNWPWLPEQLNNKFRITIDSDPGALPKIAEQCLKSVEGYYKNLPAAYPMSQQMRKGVINQLPGFLANAIPKLMQQNFPDYWQAKQATQKKFKKKPAETVSEKPWDSDAPYAVMRLMGQGYGQAQETPREDNVHVDQSIASCHGNEKDK